MAAPQRHLLDIEGQQVAISNPDKPMYTSGFTKAQVIRYYIDVSEWLLPHIAQHPITLKRYPNGTTAPHFYEKNAPKFTPQWIETFKVARREGGDDIRYVLLNNLASLVWSANLANLELHPFLARTPDIEQPLAIVFDLDPGEGTDVLTSIQVAFLLKTKLEERKLQSFAKFSGSKGIQLYVPLNTKITYAETQPFAHGLAEELEREYPNLIVSEMAKAKRKGKVFIDWSQNSNFKTTVAVYSLRAKQNQPYVALPFTWDELKRAAKKNDRSMLFLTPDDAIARLKKKGDLFLPLLKIRQKLPTARNHFTHGTVK